MIGTLLEARDRNKAADKAMVKHSGKDSNSTMYWGDSEVMSNERKGSYLRRGGNTQHAPNPVPHPMLRLIQLAEQGIKQENAAHGKKRHLKTDAENGQSAELKVMIGDDVDDTLTFMDTG